MSVTCPHCSGEVEEDFGLVECPHCNQQFMVSVDGDAEVSANEVEPGFLASDQMFDMDDSVLKNHDEASGVAEQEAYEAVHEEPNEFSNEEQHLEQIEAPYIEEVQPEELEPAPIEPTSPNISNLAGESESITQESSPFVYSINIKGIDTADIRRDLKDTLTDMRLRIDVDAIINSIDQGEVTIANVSSVKAALIVQRLRSLPVDLSWQQRRA